MVAAALLASQSGHSPHAHHQNQVDNNTTPSLPTHVQHTDMDIADKVNNDVDGELAPGPAPALGPGLGLVLEDVDDLSDIYDYMQERSHAQTQGLAQKHSFNNHNHHNHNHNSDNDDNNANDSGRGERVKPKHERSRRMGFDN